MRDPGESQYSPPPEEDDRARAYHQWGLSANNVTLPSTSPYDPPYAAPDGYTPEPRACKHDPYRNMYPSAYGRDDKVPYLVGYSPQQMNFSQSAPRQRAAIACGHCRRRKIRCSGFESSAQGRCLNCQRFQRDCIFTPVSSQAQVFIPLHDSYPHMRNLAVGRDGGLHAVYLDAPQQLYGAHGQLLGTIPPPSGQSYNEYAMPSLTSSYSSFTDDRVKLGHKRQQPEPHQSILPPPVPGQPSYPRTEGSRRPAVEDELRLPPMIPSAIGQAISNYSSTSSTSRLRSPQDQALPSRSSPGDRGDPISLGSIMEKRPDTNIDKNMLSRLGRKGQ